MNKVIVATDGAAPDAMVAYGPYNAEEAAERVDQFRNEAARYEPEAHKTYTVCDLL